MQTFITLDIGEKGKVVATPDTINPTTYQITKASNTIFSYRYNIPQDTTPPIVGFRVETLTAKGKAEYEKLTGDTESFRINGWAGQHRNDEMVMPRIYCAPDGDVKVYLYHNSLDDLYTHPFKIIYVEDINSTDPTTTFVIDNYFSSFKPYLTSGFNVFDGSKKLG
jgi:hypothetical protein